MMVVEFAIDPQEVFAKLSKNFTHFKSVPLWYGEKFVVMTFKQLLSRTSSSPLRESSKR